MADSSNLKKKILLVDDDEIHLSIAESFLKNEHEVFKAMSGDEALKLLEDKEFLPGLIMLDIVMPNMNGWELFRKIRTIDRLKDVPIVFFTSLDGEAEKKKARQLGAVDYISKPHNMTLLTSTVNKIFSANTKKR
jgi:DNA-binding response OmpR family regulator